MWQRLETGRKQIPLFDLLRAQLRKLVPGRTAGEFDSHALLHRLASRHFDSLSRAIAQIIALLKQSHVPLHDLWLSRGHAAQDGREALVDVDRRVARSFFCRCLVRAPDARWSAARLPAPPILVCGISFSLFERGPPIARARSWPCPAAKESPADWDKNFRFWAPGLRPV